MIKAKEIVMHYFVIHFCYFVHYSFKPLKGSRFPGNPVEMSIFSPLPLPFSTWCHIWRSKTIRAVIWSTGFRIRILGQQYGEKSDCERKYIWEEEREREREE